MAKETRIAFRASDELKARLQRTSKQVKMSETDLAQAAVEAAIEYIEKHGGIWLPLQIVPKPMGPIEEKEKPPAEFLRQNPVSTDAPVALTGSQSTDLARFSVNEDSPADKPSGPRARSTQPGIAKTVDPKKGKSGS